MAVVVVVAAMFLLALLASSGDLAREEAMMLETRLRDSGQATGW